MTDRPTKFHNIAQFTDQDIEESELICSALFADVKAGNRALARALDKMIEEGKP